MKMSMDFQSALRPARRAMVLSVLVLLLATAPQTLLAKSSIELMFSNRISQLLIVSATPSGRKGSVFLTYEGRPFTESDGYCFAVGVAEHYDRAFTYAALANDSEWRLTVIGGHFDEADSRRSTKAYFRCVEIR